MKITESLLAHIKSTLGERRLNQADMSRLSGINATTINKILSTDCVGISLQGKTESKLANFLNVSEAELFKIAYPDAVSPKPTTPFYFNFGKEGVPIETRIPVESPESLESPVGRQKESGIDDKGEADNPAREGNEIPPIAKLLPVEVRFINFFRDRATNEQRNTILLRARIIGWDGK